VKAKEVSTVAVGRGRCKKGVERRKKDKMKDAKGREMEKGRRGGGET
jgi:hypothetical protein